MKILKTFPDPTNKNFIRDTNIINLLRCVCGISFDHHSSKDYETVINWFAGSFEMLTLQGADFGTAISVCFDKYISLGGIEDDRY